MAGSKRADDDRDDRNDRDERRHRVTHPIRFGVQTGEQNVEWPNLVKDLQGFAEEVMPAVR